MIEYPLDQKLDALLFLDPGVCREDWHKIGRSAIAAGLSIDDIDAWSSSAGNYGGTQDVKSAFKTITVEGGTGAGTLIKLARESGWTPPLHQDGRPALARPTPKAESPHPPPAPDQGIADTWNRLPSATSQHPYALRKKLCAETIARLRVVADNDPLTQYRGWLAVPGYSIEGLMTMIEFVAPDGTKRSMKGSTKAGAMFTVGPTAGPATIVEGLGAADSVYASNGSRAIGAFGAGNIRAVVEAVRQKEPDEPLCIAPDRGKEQDAHKIAAEFNCSVACVSEAELNNTDLNDIFCRDGFDVVQAILESATMPPKPEPKVHPLARFVDFDGTAKAPRWVIPGFIGHGVVVIAGAHGVGKTTALLPLAMTAAGLHGDDLLPRQWRHVVYISEDVEQARRILAGITLHSNLGIDLDRVRERLHLVEAVRLDPAFVATVGATYREQFTRNVQGVEVLPLVVLDTKSAVLAIESENDNSEASRMMAALKQGFDGLPVWLIGHVAKTNLGRSDVAGLTSRGASAIEGDANQTLFLTQESESRYLVRGKTRFEAKWPELEIVSYTAQTPGFDEFGNVETIVMRWGIAAPPLQSRKEAAEQAAEQQRKEDEATLRQDIRDAVQAAWIAGNPLNRSGLKAKVRRKASDVVAMLENLLNERWLIEVTVPAKQRTNNNRTAFLVGLTTEEHEAVLVGCGLPAEKLVIPASWCKPPIPSVPAPECDAMEVAA